MARYLVAGGSGLWNNNNNWSAASGGAPGASFPVSTDAVIIDAASGNANITVNVASACLSFTVGGGHTGTLTYNATLSVLGNVTYDAAMTIAGTSALSVNATATLTSNGKTHTGGLTFQGTTTTITFADNWDVNGTLTCANTGAGSPLTLNGNTINVGGGLIQHSAGNRQTVGTTSIVLDGTGNWTGGTNSGLHLNLTINTAGTITVPATVNLGTSVFTYVAGTFNGSAGTLQTRAATCTLDIDGISFLNITTANTAQTITLSSNLSVTGTLTIGQNTIFAGAGEWTAGTLSFSTGTVATARDLTLVASQTYTLTTGINCSVGTSSSRCVLKSSSAGNQAILTLTNPTTQSNIYLDVTDINSSAGATGWTIGGTLSNATNWNVLPTQPQTITYSN